MINILIAGIVGIILGAVLVWIIAQNKTAKLDHDLAVLQERILQKEARLLELEVVNNALQKEIKEITAQFAKVEADNANLKERLANQLSEIENIQKQFKVEFENVAHRILKENSTEFIELNHKNMGDILLPLKEKISSFEKKVDETYEKGLRDQTSLRAELLKLNELNVRISQEANNLTRALKSDSKKQGNWGEMVLEKILESSGLNKGQEYERESVQENSEGTTIRPDVIIYLPDNKQIIIDSKVSLVAYERLVNAEDDHKRAEMIKAHLSSLRSHVKLLSEKHYQSSLNLNTPDFVLLFLPIESSFSIALQEDQDLFNYAWDRKVVIVCPSTLLATLRTVSSIWKQENQTRNAKEIARLGGTLYDKLVGFVSDLEKVKTNMDRASVSYDDAMKKMQLGNGNIFITAKKMQELGAKVSKELPAKFLE